jgi:hypothetical protein
MNDFTGRVRLDEQGPPSGTVRTYTVALDTAQYQMDMNALAAAQAGPSAPEDVYATFNMIMRRKVGAPGPRPRRPWRATAVEQGAARAAQSLLWQCCPAILLLIPSLLPPPTHPPTPTPTPTLTPHRPRRTTSRRCSSRSVTW